MGQEHHDSHSHPGAIRALGWALSINLLLTAVQIAGELISGSLALVADALSSVAIIIAGDLIILFGWMRADALCTLLVSAYVLYHGAREIRPMIRILMQSAPKDIDLRQLAAGMDKTDGIPGTHHLHVWQVDEHSRSLEAHIVVGDTAQQERERIKSRLKALIAERFDITHSTLEFENADSAACADGNRGRCHEITH